MVVLHHFHGSTSVYFFALCVFVVVSVSFSVPGYFASLCGHLFLSL